MTLAGLNYESTAIIELMDVAETDRSEEWLRDSLQQAVMLELATLPPYLCGLWSIREDDPDEAGVSLMIKEIVFNEMTHLGLACNMLTTVGGTPVLASTAVVPPYPCPLPGGVRPQGLTVYLGGLTRESVRMYSEIEKPVDPLAESTEAFPSIGAFYDAIHRAFRQPGLTIRGTRQRDTDLGHGSGNRVFPLTALAEVEQAIQVIKEQGEGTSRSPDDPTAGDGELAHYYTFRQIYRGRRLVRVQQDPPRFDFTGDPIPLPAARPMAVVPRGGWAADPSTAPVDPAVKDLLGTFNTTFSDLLRSLELAWTVEDPEKADGHLNDAIGFMFGLGGPAVELMEKPLPNDPAKYYGPEFRYVPLA
ncbi:ferritin-like protein [Kitasatospora sp. NPDC127111]|uniref:ferritin-like domain-containing protein n=1 Tax=Kitasatospora sp. NPDC127111 TaxID=3345363 RepID=UPI003636BCEB